MRVKSIKQVEESESL